MSGPAISIPRSLLDLMEAEAYRCFPNETGGVWMGYIDGKNGDVAVARVVGPGPCAVHTPTGFSPDAEYQLAEIDRCYQESGRTLQYLGDWHTHPRGRAYLSKVDCRALRLIANDPLSRQPRPFMAVLAGGDPWVLRVWRYRATRLGGNPVPCRVRAFADSAGSSGEPSG